MKARLNEAGISFRRTHDLVELLNLLEATEPLWLPLGPGLQRLTEFAVAVRYPGRYADRDDATEAFEICKRLRKLARSSLGLRE